LAQHRQKKRQDWHDMPCTSHDLQPSVLMTRRRADCQKILLD
jgi:hypothetical protein